MGILGGRTDSGSVAPDSGCECASCDYRSLYEGAISSLSEMASNQRASVSRLGALRSSLAAELEQHFPRQVRSVEARSGRRVSELSDTEVVSLLSGLLGDRTGVLRREVLAMLALELGLAPEALESGDLSGLREALKDGGPVPSAGTAGSAEAPCGDEGAEEPEMPPEPARRNADGAAAPQSASAAPDDTREMPASLKTRPIFGRRKDPEPHQGRRTESADGAPDGAPDGAQHSGAAFLQQSPSPEEAGGAPEERAAAAPAHPTTTTLEAASEPKPRPSPAELFQPPLRPGVPEAPRSAPRSRRTRRMDAGVDLPGYEPEAALPPSSLSAETRSALVAAALTPRPVFTSDLASVAGSAESVEAWEAECRSDPDSSPVRFIAPKSRHRHRGRLVVPASPSAAPSDWWARCVDRYRAGRLYELAVLLRSVSDSVTSVSLEDDVAVVRTSSESGVSAHVALLSSDVSGISPDDLAATLENLVSERLALIALLTASAERGGRDALADMARRVFVERGWRTDAPVVAANIWEYADDPRAAAVFVGTEG